MYLSRKAIDINWCNLTFLGKVVVELEEKILYWRLLPLEGLVNL